MLRDLDIRLRRTSDRRSVASFLKKKKAFLMMNIKSRRYIKKIREYSHITDLGPLSRRYFVIGTFDGALTILALVLGALAGATSAGVEFDESMSDIIFASGIAMGIGLGISSFFGAYESERIERGIELKGLEERMLTKLEGTIIHDARKFAILWSSFVHGVSPMIAAWIPVIPFLFLPPYEAMESSIIISFLILFITGMYLGKVAKRNMFISGLRFLAVGIITAVICYFIGAR